MDLDQSEVECLDSPILPTRKKRKLEDMDKTESSDASLPAPKHPLLDSISNRFQQNIVEREERNALFHSKRELEKVHSEYLKQNVADPQELAKASYAASHWAKKNGIKSSNFKPAKSNVPNAKTPPHKRRRQKKGSGQKVPMNNSVRTSTVTYASLRAGQGTSEAQDIESASDGRRGAHILKYSREENLNGSGGAHILKYPGDEVSDAKYICPVLYCETEFSSERSLGQHMNLFQHSPCNPCRYAGDGKLFPDPLCYNCPECDLEFSTEQLCSDHMKKENHLVFYPPLVISAYICPQCLYLFKTLESCWNHMEESKHNSISFPFKDDDIDNDISLPVAVAEEFVQDYISKCKKEPFQVQCLDCGMDILNPAMFRDHQDETNNLHVMSALTGSSLGDIFKTYMKPFQCDICHRLFRIHPEIVTEHKCAGGIVGHIIHNQIRTMSEFVKFCALTKIPSLIGRISRSGNQTIGKVKLTRKHDPSDIQILDFHVGGRNVDFFDELVTRNTITETDRGGDLNEKSATCQSHIIRTTTESDQPKDTKVKLEHSAVAPSKKVGSVEIVNKVTKAAGPNVNNTVSTLLVNRDQQLDHEGPIKVEKQKHRAPSNVQTTGYIMIKPSTSSAEQSDIFNIDDDDVESDDVEMYVEEVSNDLITISDSDEDESLSNQHNSIDDDCTIDESSKDKNVRIKSSKAEIMEGIDISNLSKGQRKRLRKKLRGKKNKMGSNKAINKRLKRKREYASGKLENMSTMENLELRQGTSGQTNGVDVTGALHDQDEHLISAEYLKNMKNLVFLDFDNFGKFFKILPQCPFEHTFVWAFYGGTTDTRKARLSETYQEMRQRGLVYFSERCGKTKDATDFALVLTVGKMDERLPSSVTFTIISADKGFCEVVNQMKQSSRSALLINPHIDSDVLLPLLKSIVEK